jgi:hypothetical protein
VLTTVTLKLPAKLKVRIARAARQRGKCARRWMLEAIEHEVERRERFLAYVKEARRPNPSLGPVEEFDARNRVNFWLEQLSSGRKVVRLAPRRTR